MSSDRLPIASSATEQAAPEVKASGCRTVFVSLRDWSSLRNFLREEMVKAMARSGHRFVILTPDPENEFVRQHFDHPSFVIERMEINELSNASRESRIYQFLRLIRHYTYGNARFDEMGTRRYHLAVFRRETLARANTLFGQLYFRGVVAGARIASASRLVRQMVRKIEETVMPVEPHRHLYERYRPSLLVVPSLGYSVDPLLMREARHFGARVLSIVRSWDNTTSKGYAGCAPDHVFAWHSLMRDEIVRFHDIPGDRIEVCGIPQWDIYFNVGPATGREEFCQRYGLRPDRRTIYLALAAPSNFRHNLTLIRHLLEAIHDGSIRVPSQLLVRIHPNYYLFDGEIFRGKWSEHTAELRDMLPKLKAEFGDLLAISEQHVEDIGGIPVITNENQFDLNDIYRNVDVMVNIYSTQMIEAAAFDLPIINAGYFPYRNTEFSISVLEEWDHIRRIVSTGAVVNAHSREEMTAAINADLADRSRLAAQRRRLLDQEIPSFRGDASTQTVRRLLELV